LRSAKYTLLLMIAFMFTMIGCGEKKKEISRATERMKKYNAVTIAIYAVTAPFDFGKDTGVQGLDVDLGTEIGKTLGYEVKWLKVLKQQEQLFEYLRSGDAEIVISSVAIDPARTTEFSFSHPYSDSGDSIAIQREKVEIKSLDNLSGKNVGVATGRHGEAFMASRKGVSIKKYANLDDALGGLNRAEVDAVVGDEPFVTYSSVESFPNTIRLKEKVNSYQYAVVVRKTEPELLAKINETIDRLKASGELDKLEKTWMGDKREKANERLQGDITNIQQQGASKTINVNINKVSGAWNPDRLDGFKLVLVGSGTTYTSTPILMDGNKGHCKFVTPVPPGEYKLNISILGMSTPVPVPSLRKTTLTMDLNIGNGASIQFK
jgi:ABC-type amino acid transport substrate-binding protein